jgi:hypothetical protein
VDYDLLDNTYPVDTPMSSAKGSSEKFTENHDAADDGNGDGIENVICKNLCNGDSNFFK